MSDDTDVDRRRLGPVWVPSGSRLGPVWVPSGDA